MRLEGKVALITGAAAGVEGELMGFGGAAARLFAREGARVVVTDVLEEMGRLTAEQVRESGGDAVFQRLDVTSERDWDTAVSAAVAKYGKLDVLVNNAGARGVGDVEDMTVEAWDAMMDVHAKGVMLGTRRVIPEMRRAGGGSIVNVSSISGIVASWHGGAYHAAKAAVRLFTKTTAVQHAKDGIRANSVHPGYALTPMSVSVLDDREYMDRIVTGTPMGRMGTADEIAYGFLFLASDESSFMTGAELVIDGGWTAQ